MLEESTPRSSLAFLRPEKTLKDMGPGAAVSLALHLSLLLVALLVFLQAQRQAVPPSRFIPVDVVIRLSDQTTSPPAQQKSSKPVAPAMRSPKVEQSNPRPVEGVAPERTKPVPLDNLDAKLRAFSRLHQEKSDLPVLDNTGTADEAAISDDAAAGDEAAYAIRDFVRATSERHWNLDFKLLGARRYTIPLHIVMKSSGVVVSVKILDHARYMTDAVYRSVSLSAKNAVLLSSPIQLPPGDYHDVMEMTLVFDPRDMVH